MLTHESFFIVYFWETVSVNILELFYKDFCCVQESSFLCLFSAMCNHSYLKSVYKLQKV